MAGLTSPRRLWFLILFSLCLSAVLFTKNVTASQSTPQSSPSSTPPLVITSSPTPLTLTQNVRQTVLDSGLTVLTKEVHTAPVVTVQVWYNIGSCDEAPGVNGIAHQLEHMLFKGTSDRPIQFGRLFSALGSDSNAFTSYDNTAYFGTVEREKLNALLILEADRMQNAIIDTQQLDSEKQVVISELQGYENNPGYRLSRAVLRAAFPTQAYGLPVGGTNADVATFTVEQVQEYYRNYYSPDNATLVIVGDFSTEPTLAAVQDIFGKIPKRRNSQVKAGLADNVAQNPPVQESTHLTQQASIVLREDGSAALLQSVYPLPALHHPDVPALDVMDYVLTGGRNSRLYQALVESGLASDLSGYAINLKQAGWYELSATAAPEQNLETLEQVLAAELQNLNQHGVTQEELNRAKAQLVASVLLDNRDITSQAMLLGTYQSSAGDYRFTDRYLASVQAVTPQDVQRVAQTYLTPSNCTIGFFEPTQVNEAVDTLSVRATQTSESFNTEPASDLAEVAKYLPEVGVKVTSTTQELPEAFELTNGLRVLLLRDASTPTITLSGFMGAGREFDSIAKAGLADLTADNVMNGTKTRDALAIAKALEERGASLEFNSHREGVGIAGYSLAADLPILIHTFADVVQQATFPTDQLELTRQQTLIDLAIELDTPEEVARRVFQQAIYPENHPFHTFATPESVKRITRQDVVRFYQRHYRPDTTVLTLVGDFDAVQVRSLIERQLSGWQASGKPPVANYPVVPQLQGVVNLNPVLPGKAQSVILLGSHGINRKDSRFYPALVLNQILGGDTLSSRLGDEIRERLGLTYGIYSYFQAGMQTGPFLVQLQTAPEDAAKAIASTLALLKQTQVQGVTSSELTTAKHSLISQYMVSFANPDSLAETILNNEVLGLDNRELHEFVTQIEAVTLDQVNQTAKELLHPDNLVVVTAGDN